MLRRIRDIGKNRKKIAGERLSEAAVQAGYTIAPEREKLHGEVERCWECPLMVSCALWLWDAWNARLPLCTCTDERLVALEESFTPSPVLLRQWEKANPCPVSKESRGSTAFLGKDA